MFPLPPRVAAVANALGALGLVLLLAGALGVVPFGEAFAWAAGLYLAFAVLYAAFSWLLER